MRTPVHPSSSPFSSTWRRSTEMSQLAIGHQPWTDRARRACELVRTQPHARELRQLYQALLEPQRQAFEQAQREQPAAGELSAYVASTALPGVLAATLRAGQEPLPVAGLARVHDSDLPQLVSGWLDGAEQPPFDRYLARASATPVLEALPTI